MTVFDEKMNAILRNYEDLRTRYKTELERSPEGSLIYQKKGNHLQFLHSMESDGKRIRKGVNRDTELIRSLARKEFNIKAYNILSHNIDALNEAIKKQIPFDPDDILKSMTKAYALLPEEFFFDRNKLVIAAGLDGETLARIQSHEEWWKKPYTEYWGYPEYKKKTTSRGQKTRSKSELLILESLYKYGIYHHYEQELVVNGKTYAPDVTFEGAKHKLFYIEHLGMMNNPKYAKRNLQKLDEYYDIGLIPGENLILTFDNDGNINMEMIEAIIKYEVIPRL